jgi:hypothetical protein
MEGPVDVEGCFQMLFGVATIGLLAVVAALALLV